MPEPPNRSQDQNNTLADELLAVRCMLGESEAFDALVSRWHEPLWRYLRGLINDNDAAADALQDCWLRILRGLPSLRDPSRLRPWLFGIARRTAMDRLREWYADTPVSAIDPALVATDESFDANEDELSAMHVELERLPLIEREVLKLFYLRELSLSQLADVLGVPVGTVKSRLYRARQLLRKQLLADRAAP